ncbi:MAG: aminoacyl-tRNA hydrolase [Anaerolineales bacterium]|nr:aminoacyl-tRNA hydrolase [Anaerolineales bacterium]
MNTNNETDLLQPQEAVQRFLIVGLGNPGRKYRVNRHNIGFLALDKLAATFQISLGKIQNKAIIGNGRIDNNPVILAKPQTYMNDSGMSVGPLAHYYKIPVENILVIYDELDIPLGTLRLRKKGGAGGHNGMRSLIQHLGQDFPRLRLGIGRPPGKMPPAAYVLQDFGKDEEPIVQELLETAVAATESFVYEGIDNAMNKFNRKMDD